MSDGILDAMGPGRSVSLRTMRPRRARRHVPLWEGALERREVLSPFPLSGTFSGNYSTRAAQGGIGQGQEVSGTITVTIAVSSTRDVGGGYSQAFISGTVSETGFVGGDASYPFAGSVEEQGQGVETGYSSADPQSTVEIVISGFNQDAPQNYITITGSCLTNSIIANVNIGNGDYVTPNAASVTLSGSGSGAAPTPSPSPAPAVPTGAVLVKAKKGAEHIVVAFSGPLDGGSGLPLGDFGLTAGTGKKHAKAIPLALVAYDSAHQTAMLTLRHKLTVKGPLNLTVSGLSGGPSTLTVARR
jgi:hypothetical protein